MPAYAQAQTEIEKLSSFITSDLEIIELRNAVLKSAESQLKNGVITSSAYITELTHLFEDQNMLVLYYQIYVSKNQNQPWGNRCKAF